MGRRAKIAGVAALPARRGMTRYFADDPQELRIAVSAVVWRDRSGSASGEILLMRRSDNGFWGPPGGYVELGESVAAAAAREVLEETGVRIELRRLVGVYRPQVARCWPTRTAAACTRSTCVLKP
jgi:ADP-ribose pyrophosphatase YjhB (NUDIX family)